MTRAIIALDVDGVLNPFLASEEWNFEPCRADGFNLLLSRDMGAALLGSGADIFWLSTWMMDGDGCNIHIGPKVGFPYLPNLPAPEKEFGSYGWSTATSSRKEGAMNQLLKQPGPPVIWIDDDCAGFEVRDPHGRLTKISPDFDVGITRAHINQIRAITGVESLEGK